MMSNSNDETLQNIKQNFPSKERFADKAGPSNASQITTTPFTPETDTANVTNTPSTDDIQTDYSNFALSKIFNHSLVTRLTSKKAILKESFDCSKTDNDKKGAPILALTYMPKGKICQKRLCLCRRQNSDSQLNQERLKGSNSSDTPWEMLYDRYGYKCMMAMHVPRSVIKYGQVQPLCKDR